MKEPAREMLKRLGAGETIESVCHAAGISRAEFNQWWDREVKRRVPDPAGQRQAAVHSRVQISRDGYGIPHIFAGNEHDLFLAFGYAMAQDRLFQLDYLRRKGAGRLAEVLGPAAIELDLIARTVGLPRIARAEWQRLPEHTRQTLEAFAQGINLLIEESRSLLPIEFDLLDYQPEPWTPLDSLVIESEFRWYLTGRFPVIVMPELAKRHLQDDALAKAFLNRESDVESMIPVSPRLNKPLAVEPLSPAIGRPEPEHRTTTSEPAPMPPRQDTGTSANAGEKESPFATGSNNWVVSGQRSTTGKPLLASDPHIALEAVSCWYEVHLCGADWNVAGMSYAGMPAVMFGRNERVAWGCTNNICSQRDLYQEQTDPAKPGAFLFDGRWEPGRTLEEVIQVRGGDPIRTTVHFSRHGPIVNAILPAAARQPEPVSLRWLGAHAGGWLTALLAMNRAASVSELRQAARPWHVPTFNLVIADVDGHFGYQMTGRIPARSVAERGYRPGWLPEHEWLGLIPFDSMPHSINPESGYAITANHRPAPDDFPYPLAGTWTDDWRARRIRQRIDAKPQLAPQDFASLQQDSLSLRAARLVPHLISQLKNEKTDRVQRAVQQLEAWDYRYEPDRTGAPVFEVFFNLWVEAVTHARFDGDAAALLINGINGLAADLLAADPLGWFAPGKRESEIRLCFQSALDYLANRLGSDPARWTWGAIHTLPLRHVLSTRGDLSQLLDHGGLPCSGTGTTVCNTWPNPDYSARSGAGYRMIADLASSPPALWAIDAQSQSGHPGSPHYADQLMEWLAGRHHEIKLDREPDPNFANATSVLVP